MIIGSHKHFYGTTCSLGIGSIIPRGVIPCLLLSMNMMGLAQETGTVSKSYGSPGYGVAIREFEDADRRHPPPTNAIVCIGSSSMKLWRTVAQDLAPLTVIARGFGGSNMNEALHYADRIVIPYKPRAVVVYEGDNDIARGITPERVRDAFRAFAEKVHGPLPEARIYFLSIKPSPSRWPLWPRMQEANRLIAAHCAGDKRLVYVDVASAMLDANGEPRKDIFQKDNLHMTKAGYDIWRDVLKPVLMRNELSFEPRPIGPK